MAKDLNTPQALVELIGYQQEAVVSRELVRNAGGTVTLFAFDESEGLSEHTAPFDALVQVVEGEMEIMVGGVAHEVRVGSVILMPANTPHALRAKTQAKMVLTMVRG